MVGTPAMLRPLLLVVLAARIAYAASLAETIDVSGDSISRGFDADTSSCNYGGAVSRNWATGDDHGSSFLLGRRHHLQPRRAVITRAGACPPRRRRR